MKVLVVNNFVRQGSGIDASVNLEVRALSRRGHQVDVVRRDNAAFERASGPARVALLASSLYSVPVGLELSRRLQAARPDVVHLHNLVPFVTGAAYDACRRHGVPTVQHLRNYRAFCLSSYAYRDGRPCDACARSAFAASVLHKCYRGSYAASAALCAARWVDWARGRRSGYGADAYIANSAFTAERHVAHGLPAGDVRVLLNPAEDLGALLPGGQAQIRRSAATPPRLTFVGSLIAAKGVWPALELAAALPEFEVRFVGTGDDEPELRQAAHRRALANVTFQGLLSGATKAAAWAESFLTLVPSLWDEPFGLVVPESYSLGVPVLATTSGGLAETVKDGTTGLRLDASRLDDAVARVRELWNDQPRYLAMRAAARAEYELRYTEEAFAARLEELLAEAASAGARAGAGARAQGRAGAQS